MTVIVVVIQGADAFHALAWYVCHDLGGLKHDVISFPFFSSASFPLTSLIRVKACFTGLASSLPMLTE